MSQASNNTVVNVPGPVLPPDPVPVVVANTTVVSNTDPNTTSSKGVFTTKVQEKKSEEKKSAEKKVEENKEPDTKIEYKYNEDVILAELKNYLDSTYGQHYTSNKTNIQCFDAWISRGDSTATFVNTAMKYLWRYGKKNGNNKDDLMKALHYVFMAIHVDHHMNKQ